MDGIIAVAVLVGGVMYLLSGRLAYIIVYDYQKALWYKNGAFQKLLPTGKHWFLKKSSSIVTVDARNLSLNVSGQEVLTKDQISVKLSVSGFYQVVDAVKAKREVDNYLAALYAGVQTVLRDLVSAMTLDELLEKKAELDAGLFEKTKVIAESLGLEVPIISVRDVMLSAQLKKAYAGVMEAKKEAQRQLEKARGEQAVLRSLANSSQLYNEHPMLLQARVIQSLSTGNHTIVFNADETVQVAKK